LELRNVSGTIALPSRAGRLRARLHELGAVRGEQACEDGWRIQVELAEAEARRLAAGPEGHALAPLLPTPENQRSHFFGAGIAWNAPGNNSSGKGPRQRGSGRSEEHTSELQSRENLVCRLLLEKKQARM